MERIFLAGLLVYFCLPLFSSAEVYKWTDETGTVHYSTSKQDDQAAPVKLPKIMKGDVKIPESLKITCVDHGGINCSAGPDEDGSVVCQDGYRDAVTRFVFNCKTAKLEITEISDLDEEGNFLVYVRNKSAVRAEKVKVQIFLTEDKPETLEGADKINSFQAAEYKIPGLLMIGDPQAKPKKEQIVVECENCL